MLQKIVLYTLCLFIIFGLATCKTKPIIYSENSTTNSQGNFNLTSNSESDITLSKIAFGSCARQDLSQHIWADIVDIKPDLWIWLGDNIYATPKATPEILKEKYAAQKNNVYYQAFLKANIPIIGIWDDNDYGMSDGGKNYAWKKESQQMMLDFLGVAVNAPQRKREGIYATYVYGKAKRQVKVILLDTRYFRDNLVRDTVNKLYLPNPEGDMLGEAQWKWLESELKNSKAQVHIIASGIQILSNLHPFEKWSNLPNSRKKLFDLIQKYHPSNTILITGDRHVGEIDVISLPNYKNLYEITSSGITHSGTIRDEENPYRIGSSINQLHYSTIEIDWKKRPIGIVFKIIGEKNVLLRERRK